MTRTAARREARRIAADRRALVEWWIVRLIVATPLAVILSLSHYL